MVSRCCKDEIYIYSAEGCDFYVCGKCNRDCATLSILGWVKECNYDAGRENQAQEFIGQT